MNIRKGTADDVSRIMEIYAAAKQIMVDNGNSSQWVNGYPQRELVEEDIANGYCHVCEEDGGICAVFAYIPGDDPTYAYIEDGKWPNDKPYGTIHRIGADRPGRGVLKEAAAYCSAINPELRIDTHENNGIMRNAVKKLGFTYCGIIYIDDGTPRLAYQRSGE